MVNLHFCESKTWAWCNVILKIARRQPTSQTFGSVLYLKQSLIWVDLATYIRFPLENIPPFFFNPNYKIIVQILKNSERSEIDRKSGILAYTDDFQNALSVSVILTEYSALANSRYCSIGQSLL